MLQSQRRRLDRLDNCILSKTLDGDELHLEFRIVRDELLDDGDNAVTVRNREANNRSTLCTDQAKIRHHRLQAGVSAQSVPDQGHPEPNPQTHASLCETHPLEGVERLRVGAKDLSRGTKRSDGNLANDGLHHILVHCRHAHQVHPLNLPNRRAVVHGVRLHAVGHKGQQSQRDWVGDGQHQCMANEVQHSTEDHTQDVSDSQIHDFHVFREPVQHTASRVGIPPPERS
mmetsp:Transcript_9870/g.24558  ORF Transcript_9870/g.24558 Transcript_9870/m.24558 type:complete len:229 (-) Transcript_9870:429-1115(-)